MSNSTTSQIFVSTGAFELKSLPEIIELCLGEGFNRLELSSVGDYNQEAFSSLKKANQENGFEFLIHNYFPPPATPFVLNLASNDPVILELSKKHCKKSIDLAFELGIPFYSVHSGFCVHAEPRHLGKSWAEVPRFSPVRALDIFIDSLRELADYGSDKEVGLLFENNVAAPFNLLNGKNELLLAVTDDEIKYILDETDHENIGVLLDVGHLKVSAETLGFSPAFFIERLADKIQAIHLSENNSLADTHEQISVDSWFWEPLKKNARKGIPMILETGKIPVESINEQLAIVATMLNHF